MKITRNILAVIQAVFTLLGFCILGVVFLDELSSPFNWIITTLLFFIGIYVSIKVYRIIMRRGYISAISGNNSTYELDQLKPIPGSGVFEFMPEELTQFFADDKLSIKKGSIAIWGDWDGRFLNKKHKLNIIQFDKNILTLHFGEKCQLVIRNPLTIHCTDNYLKIINAKEVLWQVENEKGDYDKFCYLNTGERIETKSNTDWKPKREDLGIGMNAIYIQG